MRAKKEVDTWNAKCDKAERALDKAQKRFNEAPDDATQEELDAIRKKLNAAQGKLQELYFNLPYSLDDVAGEFYAKLRVEEMVAEGEVTPKKRKRITADQVAEVVNRYLSMQHGLVIVDHVHRYNRHEWELQATAGYSAPHEHIPAHNDILGRIWVDVLTEEGQVSGWRMGYGVARDELELGDKFRMATEFRGAYRAVEIEFGGLEEPEDKVSVKKPKTTARKRPRRDPWDVVQNEKHRFILRLWHPDGDGKKAGEIAKIIFPDVKAISRRDSGHVTKIIHHLRKVHGKKVVPYRSKIQRK